MSKKLTKAQRIAEQKAFLEQSSKRSDELTSSRAKSDKKPSIFARNMVHDSQMKLEEANRKLEELTKRYSELKESNSSPEQITVLEEQIKNLQTKATLNISPSNVFVTRFANRDELFFKTAEFFDLVESIKENGQAIPITVRKSNSGTDQEFELISGRRRLEACRLLEQNVIAILVEADDKKLTELQVLENFRDDLTHFEEADNFKLMIEEGFFRNATELSKAFSISKGRISQLLSIAKIPLWLRQEFLIETSLSNREYPGGEIKEVVELDIAPSRACYNLSTASAIKYQSIDESLKSKLMDSKAFIKAETNLNKRVSLILKVLNGDDIKPMPSKQESKERLKFGSKVVAEISSQNGTWNLKVPKKYNSAELTERLDAATRSILSEYFEE